MDIKRFKRYNLTIIKLCVILGLLSGCGNKKEIDEELVPFNTKFERIAKECKLKPTDSSLKFSTSREKLYGWCQRFDGEVLINRRNWHTLSTVQKEQLVFHELGHCRLNQDHNDDDLNVMNTGGFIDEETYTEHYNYFIRKLFVGCKAPLFKKFEYKEIK